MEADIEALQYREDAETFKKASQFFLQKWKNDEDQRVRDSIQYFENQCPKNYNRSCMRLSFYI